MKRRDHTKKWRKLHAQNCARKVRYANYELALKGALAYRKKWGTYMSVYQCFHCSLYHIGHKI